MSWFNCGNPRGRSMTTCLRIIPETRRGATSEHFHKAKHALTFPQPARTKPICGVLEWLCGPPTAEKESGSRMSAVAFYWCLSARPPFSEVDLGQPCRLWRESFPPINEWLMFGVLCKVNYWLMIFICPWWHGWYLSFLSPLPPFAEPLSPSESA